MRPDRHAKWYDAASPGFYLMPRTIDDLVDFMAARALDRPGVDHAIEARWTGPLPAAGEADEG